MHEGQTSVGPRGRELLANLFTAASVARRHGGRSPVQLASVGLRLLPRPARRTVVRLGRRWGRPDLVALALAADGRRPDALRSLEAALEERRDGIPSRGADGTTRLAEAAGVLQAPQLAERLIAVAGADPRTARGDRLARVTALAAVSRGDLGQALAAVDARRARSARALAARLRGEVQVLRHELLSEQLPAAQPPAARSAGPDGPAGLRVVHVVTNSLPEVQAGYTLRTQGIARAQLDLGQQPTVVTRLGFPVDVGRLRARHRLEVNGVPHVRLLPDRPLPLPGRRAQQLAVEELVRAARDRRADLLHAHSKHENGQVALLAAHRLGIPVVYEARGFLEETWRSRGGGEGTDHYRWSQEAETAVMLRAHQVVVLSAAMRDAVLARPGAEALAGRLHVVPNGVDGSFLEPVPATEAAALRQRLGLRDTDTVVGTVTTLNDYEGVDVLVAAMAQVEDPGIRLLVVGGGPELDRLQRLAAPLGDRVVLTGRVPHHQVRTHLAVLDAFCVPRRDTPVTRLVPPLKPVEAMAAGLPVLASDLPPLAETVPGGSVAGLLPPGDPAAWARRIERVRYDSAGAVDDGARARRLVSTERTWAAIAGRYAEIYASALGT